MNVIERLLLEDGHSFLLVCVILFFLLLERALFSSLSFS